MSYYKGRQAVESRVQNRPKRFRVRRRASSGTPRAALFQELAQAAEDQAQMWVAEMHKRDEPVPTAFHSGLRTRTVDVLTRLCHAEVISSRQASRACPGALEVGAFITIDRVLKMP